MFFTSPSPLTPESGAGEELDIHAYTRKIKEELTRLEDDCLTDFLTIDLQVGTLYSELNQSNKIKRDNRNIIIDCRLYRFKRHLLAIDLKHKYSDILKLIMEDLGYVTSRTQ
jgi:hypothetical protein